MYLRFAAAASAGIKCREGRLEVKARIKSEPLVMLPGGSVHGVSVHGVMEWWEKQLISENCEVESLESGWIEVGKYRLLKDLAATRIGADRVSAEVAELKMQRKLYWTIGFEAGPGLELADQLRGAAEAVLPDLLAAAGISTLGGEQSMSYPEWLLRQDPA